MSALQDRYRVARDRMRSHPGWVIGLSLGGLLTAILIAGLVGLTINRNVERITANALTEDVELEDLGDELRVAVLDVRHYHRDLAYFGSEGGGVTIFNNAYTELLMVIDHLEELGIDDPALPDPAMLEEVAEEYYAVFAPAIDQYETGSPAFIAASNQGLDILSRLQLSAEQVDRLGERRAAAALANVDGANEQARLILLAVLGGLGLVGAALAWSAVRVVRQIRGLYEAQQMTAARLTDALQAKNDLIADASHELRTPLTVLRGNAEAGLAMEHDCVHREILEEIVKESARMTRLVEDLLFLARSDSASLPLKIEPVAVEPLILSIGARAELLVREHDRTFFADLTGTGVLNVDQTRLEQAVMILVDNAAKFGPPDKQIRLITSTWNDAFTIEVADRGPGIPNEDLSRVFERFYRVDRARLRRLGGAGLGLSIAKTIVEAHGGRIEAESRVGEGTKMRLSIPLAGSVPAAPPPTIVSISPPRTTAAVPKCRPADRR